MKRRGINLSHHHLDRPYFDRSSTHRQSNNHSRIILIAVLRSPWAIVLSVGLSIYLGTYQPQFAAWIAPIGSLYLGLLKMCVLPILLAAITGSMGKLMQANNAGQSIRRVLTVFPLGLLTISGIATTIGALTQPGKNLPRATLERLGVLVNQSGLDLEISLSDPATDPAPFTINPILTSLIPDNIFSALSEGQTLKVLLFSIIFGIALGLVKEPVTNSLFDVLDSVYKACNHLIQGLTLLLPIGLCSLLSTQISQLGIDVLLAMIRFVIVTIFTFITIYSLSTLIIWRRASHSLPTILLKLKEPTLLALATSSSLACLPSAIATLSDGLRFDRQTTQLVTPLSITLCRFGSVIYFALATLFVAQLYNKEIGVADWVIVVIGSILAGMSTSGATGVLTLTMLDIVLNPLKLPLEAVLVLLIAIDPILDPLRTLGIVHSGMAATALVARQEREVCVDQGSGV
ncbi:MAG: dicarboxylate/amino acid:cation symporter [Elainella sp. Prado103]|nr:dicarboxylate/amino acid:cation symporter [Elainella sp. Prado103]